MSSEKLPLFFSNQTLENQGWDCASDDDYSCFAVGRFEQGRLRWKLVREVPTTYALAAGLDVPATAPANALPNSHPVGHAGEDNIDRQRHQKPEAHPDKKA